MTETQLNAPALIRLADFAEAQPEVHSQAGYFESQFHQCRAGTIRESGILPGKACLAGMTAVLFAPPETEFCFSGRLILPGGENVTVFSWSTDFLGMTSGQAAGIFLCFDRVAAITRLRHLAARPALTFEDLEFLAPAREFLSLHEVKDACEEPVS